MNLGALLTGEAIQVWLLLTRELSKSHPFHHRICVVMLHSLFLVPGVRCCADLVLYSCQYEIILRDYM